MGSFFQEKYKKEIIPKLKEEHGYKNPMQVPVLERICINMGVGENIVDSKVIEKATEELSIISGQKPVITYAKKSIAGFKLREGQAIGCKVTLRGRRMYEFAERLVNIVLPRVRDFRGLLSKSFDGRGNFSFGLKEQLVFPEINYDRVDNVRGMNIVIVTTANTDMEAKSLLKKFNFPFNN